MFEPSTLARCRTNTINYDSDLRPTSISTPGVENLAFTYDAADRITKITNGMNGSYTQTLGYDALDRLTSVASGAQTASYAYDADGNRTQQVVNGVTTHYSYPAGSNRLASSSGGSAISYGYNAYGSTTTLNGLTAYTYDPFGRLANAGGAGFVVSAEDQRLQKTSASGTTYFVPDAGGAMLAESLNGTWYDYVWLNGRLVTVIANGGVFPVHADQTGRPLALTHPATQAIPWQAAGLAFDRSVTQNNWGPFNVGFPGQYWDSETGLWQNGYRDYDATTGRYIQNDPIGLAGGVNTYAYVAGNPITSVDPSGLQCDSRGCWNTPLELSLATAGNYSGYYAVACTSGDSYACAARIIATGEGGDLSALAGAKFTNSNLRYALKRGGSKCPDADMESIRKDLMNARVVQLSGATSTNPKMVSAAEISAFHNAVFGEYGATRGWGPFPVFGGDIPILGNIGGWKWCSSPACKP